MIKRDKVDGSAFRQVLTALIISDNFLAEFSEKYNESFFVAKFAGRIAKWCLDFYKQYEEAPKVHIQDIFDEAVRTSDIDKEELQLIEDLLLSLNDDYSNNDLNVKFLMKKVAELKDKQDFESFKNELSEAVSNKDIEYAKSLVKEFQVLEDDSEEIDDKPELMLSDEETVTSIFSTNKEPLIRYTGAYGELVNNAFIRNSLVAFRMEPGTGKTWCLADIAVKSLQNRLNVIYFQTGDLSLGQKNERLVLSMSGIPRRPLKEDHRYPVIDCYLNMDGSCPMNDDRPHMNILDENKCKLPYEKISDKYTPCNRCFMKGIKQDIALFHLPYYSEETMTKETVKKWQKIFTSRMRGKHFLSKTFANESLNVSMIDKLVKKWKKEYNFTVDIIIIDYADILKPETGTERDEKTVIDKRYKKLRRLGQEHNCCVVIAEQKKLENEGMSSFVGSSSKNMHISDGFEGHRSSDDQQNMILRMNAYKRRDEEYNKADQVILLQDLNRGIYHLSSYWSKDEHKFENKVEDKKKFYKKKY